MIPPNRIASGLAHSLPSSANPDAKPEPPIEAAFRRCVRPGPSIGATSRGCAMRALLYKKEARHGPC